jgi:NAD(P)H-nitrite reductase large subunit
MRHIIIGNSYAGINAVESIREIDKDGEIIMISEEPYRAYARPLIAYYLSGRVADSDMYYREPAFYKKHRIRLFTGERVGSIDTEKQNISLDNGTSFRYDRLLISTGGKPSVTKMEGFNARNIFTFTRWDDAKKIRKFAKREKRGIVLGGGLIGVKAAEGLNACGVKVMMVISSPRILSLVLDEISGEIVNNHLRRSGIKTIIGHSVKDILTNPKGDAYGVILDNNKRLECDILIVAKGVRPNIDFIKNTSIHIKRGIVVDRQMRTNIKNIYAAGDVAEAWDILNNRNSVIAIAPLACEQGRVAGFNMAGVERFYSGGIGMNSIEVAGLTVMTLGISNTMNGNTEIKHFHKGRLYRKLMFYENRLAGAILVGDVRYGGILTHLIRSQADIKDIKKELIDYALKTGEFISLGTGLGRN